jgi:hypothetical protein
VRSRLWGRLLACANRDARDPAHGARRTTEAAHLRRRRARSGRPRTVRKLVRRSASAVTYGLRHALAGPAQLGMGASTGVCTRLSFWILRGKQETKTYAVWRYTCPPTTWARTSADSRQTTITLTTMGTYSTYRAIPSRAHLRPRTSATRAGGGWMPDELFTRLQLDTGAFSLDIPSYRNRLAFRHVHSGTRVYIAYSQRRFG